MIRIVCRACGRDVAGYVPAGGGKLVARMHTASGSLYRYKKCWGTGKTAHRKVSIGVRTLETETPQKDSNPSEAQSLIPVRRKEVGTTA